MRAHSASILPVRAHSATDATKTTAGQAAQVRLAGKESRSRSRRVFGSEERSGSRQRVYAQRHFKLCIVPHAIQGHVRGRVPVTRKGRISRARP
jgi:hypothetical protein